MKFLSPHFISRDFLLEAVKNKGPDLIINPASFFTAKLDMTRRLLFT